MIILLSTYIFFLIYWAWAKKECKSNQKAKVFFLLVCTFHLLILYNFFDDSIVTDRHSYRDDFAEVSERIGDISKERNGNRYEIGWYLFNKTIAVLHGSYKVLFLFTYLFILFSYFKTFKKYSAFVLFSVILFYSECFYNSIFILRQWMAMGLCFMSLKYVVDRDLKRYLCLFFLAVCFHYSAIVFLPIYFLYCLRINFKILALMLVAAYFFMALIDFALELFVAQFSALDAYNKGETGGELQSIKPTMMSLCILAFSYFSFRSFNQIDGINKVAFIMVFVGFIMNMYGMIGTSFELFSRLATYYTEGLILLLPNALCNIRNRQIRSASFIIITMFYMLLFYNSAQYGYRMSF